MPRSKSKSCWPSGGVLGGAAADAGDAKARAKMKSAVRRSGFVMRRILTIARRRGHMPEVPFFAKHDFRHMPVGAASRKLKHRADRARDAARRVPALCHRRA